MSKITFRADDDLVEQIEALDASKSEVMREALREYLDGGAGSERAPQETAAEANANESSAASGTGSLDGVLEARVDELVTERLATRERQSRDSAQDINVNVTLESDAPVRAADAHATGARTNVNERAPGHAEPTRGEPSQTASDTGGESDCGQCGETLSDDHVYCPNCGEKAARRLFCDCGDEIRSDWGFCPSCGRRTPAADVFDQS
ncbi:double zinc ribbon domain-containing protein [Halorussus halophilus]|uniref:double zinc ribbon domain-containing protein n=1 Tax=Halorussus halophilus TaxID=2650975 RepID=UPI001300EBC6|nr:zinc ribbon domain-containing protein [Halorussus halophilus]